MTISDEELYRLAVKLKERRHSFGEGQVTEEMTKNFLAAVLQRFKPREPRVIERWGYVRKLHFEDCANENVARSLSCFDGCYLAKAVITEVMEDKE